MSLPHVRQRGADRVPILIDPATRVRLRRLLMEDPRFRESGVGYSDVIDWAVEMLAEAPAGLVSVDAVAPAINGLLSTGWLMDSLSSPEGWSGEPNSHQWLYDAIVAAGKVVEP